jgi:hypothetical protein
MKHILLSFSFIVFSFSFLFSQITINSSDINTIIGSAQKWKWKDSATVNLGSAGENQVWDFSNVIAESLQMMKIVERNSTPFGSQFPLANYVLQTINEWSNDTTIEYYRITPQNYFYEGFVELGMGSPLLAKYTPEFLLVNFPLNYTNVWRSTTKMKMTQESAIYDSAIVNVKVGFQCDGWGKIIINAPGLDTLDVLRLRHNDTAYVTAYIGAFPVFRDTIRTINYLFLAKYFGIVCEVESFDGETNPNFTHASSFRHFYAVPVDVHEGQEQPLHFSLRQNFPNPFNPTTSLSFTLAHSSLVTLVVFDVIGNEVVTLFNNVSQDAGEHQISFDASSLSSGIYFYRLTVNNELGENISATKSMILVK